MNALKTPTHLPLTLPRLLAITMILVTGVFAGCASDEGDGGMQSTATVFDGARVIVGNGTEPIENARIVVDGGLIT